MTTKPLANNHNYHLGNFLGSLKVAQKQKKLTFSYWPGTKYIISVARALRDEGFVSGFELNEEQTNYRITVHLRYYPITGAPLITFLQTYATPSRQYNIKYKRLIKMTRGKPSNLYFLSTPYGILTSEQCLSRALGGNLLFRIR